MSNRNQHLLSRRFEVESPRRGLFIFILLSLLINLPLPYAFYKLLTKEKKVARKVVRVQMIRRRSNRKRRLYRKRRQLARFKEIKRKKKKIDLSKLKGQIVDLAPTKDNRPPPNARFLSAYNTRVKKQSISRHRRLKYRVAMNEPTRKKKAFKSKKARRAKRNLIVKSNRPSKPAKQAKANKKQKRRAVLPGLVKKSKNRRLRIPKLSRKKSKRRIPKGKRGKLRFRKRFKVALDFKGPHKRLRLSVGQLKVPNGANSKQRRNGGRRMPDIYDLRPSFGKVSRVTGAPAPDYVKGIKVGDKTLLNSRRFVYATYFNRIKQAVAQHWSPGRVYQRRDPYGNVYGSMNRYTLLAVVLDRKGKLSDVTVKKTSGLRFLDKEAIRAFKIARQFPNPPTALIGTDGKIRFKFGFMLELSSRPGFFLFR